MSHSSRYNKHFFLRLIDLIEQGCTSYVERPTLYVPIFLIAHKLENLLTRSEPLNTKRCLLWTRA